jgi:hypothetical protein
VEESLQKFDSRFSLDISADLGQWISGFTRGHSILPGDIIRILGYLVLRLRPVQFEDFIASHFNLFFGLCDALAFLILCEPFAAAYSITIY